MVAVSKGLGMLFDATGIPVPIRPETHGLFEMDGDDWLLAALLTDNVFCPELLWDDPTNREYAGMYTVRDYQIPLFRGTDEGNYQAFATARAVGKTESIKARAFGHVFKRLGENMLVTAPQLIHLLPLTDAIEDRISACRLTRAFLDTDNGRTGFTHRPFGVDYKDRTKVVGRIPTLSGVGVKGQHEPDLIIDEAQDYPEKGWNEIHETVNKWSTDKDGNPDFSYLVYGVHSGARDSGFWNTVMKGGFKVVQITALQRHGWGAPEKNAAKARYGETASPDYRRNILGEPGSGYSPLFNLARLVACMDQDRESEYNTQGYRFQEITSEEFDQAMIPIADMLDLPAGLKRVWAGADLGLTNSPTVFTVWSEEKVGGAMRLKLVRRIHLRHMKTRQIRFAMYALFSHFGNALKGFAMDETGLGFPIMQEIEDDEHKPAAMDERFSGWFFNAKTPVGIEKGALMQDHGGSLTDQYGASVTERTNPLTNATEYLIHMPMIEASTRYLRELVDNTYLMLPFDQEVLADFQGETTARVQRIAGLKSKPQGAMHILDSARAMVMAFKAADVAEAIAEPTIEPVFEISL